MRPKRTIGGEQRVAESSPSASSRWSIASLATIASASVFVFYLVLRFEYATFYQPLGTTPEEVGLSETQILGEAAITVGALSLAITAIVVLGMLAYAKGLRWYVRRRFGKQPLGPNTSPTVYDAVLELLRSSINHVDFAPAWLADLPEDRRSQVETAARKLISQTASSWWLGLFVRGWGLVLFRGWRVLTALSAATMVLSLIGVLVAIDSFMGNDAYRIENGQPAQPIGTIMVPATHADITLLTGGQLPISPNDCLMFLGESNGTMVFYDVPRHATVRLPASAVVVMSDTAPAGCLSK
jgi:hypothetical protein